MRTLALGVNDPPDAAALGKPGAAKAWEAAQKFEASTLAALLTPMLATVDQGGGAFGGGSAEAAWRPMLTDQMARGLTAAGGVGLAVPVFKQLMRLQESAP